MSELADKIELLIDGASLNEVLNAIQDVCWAKAEHLRDNWQDRGTAKLWDAVGKALSSALVKTGSFGL